MGVQAHGHSYLQVLQNVRLICLREGLLVVNVLINFTLPVVVSELHILNLEQRSMERV